MAICSGKGQPQRGRAIPLRAGGGGRVRAFVFHDADLSGLHRPRDEGSDQEDAPPLVDVVDIGLRRGRRRDGTRPGTLHAKDISGLRMTLTELAQEYLYNQHPSAASGQRFEINASSPIPVGSSTSKRSSRARGRAEAHPPRDDLDRLTKMYQAKVDDWVTEPVDEIIGMKKLKKDLGKKYQPRFKLGWAKRWIQTAFGRDDTQPWRKALGDTLQAAYKRKYKAEIHKDVLEHLKQVGKEKRAGEE